MQNDKYTFIGRYRFIGANGSNGYKRGVTYRLRRRAVFDQYASSTEKITIERTGLRRVFYGPGMVLYQNAADFYRNWVAVK